MSESTVWRPGDTVTFSKDPDPVVEVGMPVYGMTTDNEPFTLYVTKVHEDGSFEIGGVKPEA